MENKEQENNEVPDGGAAGHGVPGKGVDGVKPKETGERKGERNSKGQFVRGCSGNPGGGPRKKRTATMEIAAGVREFERVNGVPYWHAATLLAMQQAQRGNCTLLGKLMDKILPTKYEAELSAPPVAMPTITDHEGTPVRFKIGSQDPKQLPEIEAEAEEDNQ